MFLIVLADFGKLFTRGIKFLWAFVRRLYYTGSCRKVRRTVPVQVSYPRRVSIIQFTEHKESPFAIADSVYGSTFCAASGFHGIHVLILIVTPSMSPLLIESSF